MGYLREDPVEDSPYRRIRDRFERAALSPSRLRSVYARVDCLFFLHRHSMEVARREQPLRDSDHLWYGLRPGSGADAPDRRGFVHCGSLAEHKLIDLLLDALDRVRTPVTVSLFGGDRARIEALQRAVRDRPCAARLDFRGWRPHADLRRELPAFRYGIALQEGLKVVDYLEGGLTPIVPALPSYQEVLDTRHAVFFRPDDPDSLASGLDRAGERAADPTAVRELCERFSVERRAARILARLG
jgi:glycosyltransferase involved in cell wall biosynthesis